MTEPRIGRRALLGTFAASAALLIVTPASAAPAPAPKLAILSIKLKPGSDKRFPGETIEVTVKLKNVGPSNAKAHVSLSVLVETEKKKKDGTIEFGTARGVGKPKKIDLPPTNALTTVELSFPAPAVRANDTGKMRARVKFAGGPSTGSEANVVFHVKPRPKP